jgi:hypothetical protein
MGAVEEKRALLKHPSKTLAAQTQAARREWIRWTKILVTTAENAGISPADDALLFAPLREALQKKTTRAGTTALRPRMTHVAFVKTSLRHPLRPPWTCPRPVSTGATFHLTSSNAPVHTWPRPS